MPIFVNHEPERAGEERLKRRDINLSIALDGVPISNLEQSPLCMDWNEQLGAGHQFFIVHVSRMNS